MAESKMAESKMAEFNMAIQQNIFYLQFSFPKLFLGSKFVFAPNFLGASRFRPIFFPDKHFFQSIFLEAPISFWNQICSVK